VSIRVALNLEWGGGERKRQSCGGKGRFRRPVKSHCLRLSKKRFGKIRGNTDGKREVRLDCRLIKDTFVSERIKMVSRETGFHFEAEGGEWNRGVSSLRGEKMWLWTSTGGSNGALVNLGRKNLGGELLGSHREKGLGGEADFVERGTCG